MASTLRLLRFLTLATILLAPLYAGLLLATKGHQTGTSAFSDWWKQQQRAEQLRGAWDIISQSEEAAEAIIWDLIEGRLSLRQAAAEMDAAMENRIPADYILRNAFPGQSKEESSLRWALRRTELRLENDSRRPEVLRRLRAEL
jgi:hypothetical protein